MLKPPPWPGFDGLHPLVVHFPIALFIVAPIFLIAAMVLWRQRIAMLGAAALLMVLAAVSLFVTVASGEAAGEMAERNPAINGVLERHEELAETSRNVFSALTLMLAAAFAVAVILKDRVKRTAWMIGLTLYVLVYAGALLLLVNTAHLGGRLVHELGVRSTMSASSAGGGETAEARDD